MKKNPKKISNTNLEKIRGSTKEGYEAIDSMKERIVVLKPLSTITELSLQWRRRDNKEFKSNTMPTLFILPDHLSDVVLKNIISCFSCTMGLCIIGSGVQ